MLLGWRRGGSKACASAELGDELGVANAPYLETPKNGRSRKEERWTGITTVVVGT